MATKHDREELKETNRELRKALHDCHEMLAKAEAVLRQTRQDNYPLSDPNQS